MENKDQFPLEPLGIGEKVRPPSKPTPAWSRVEMLLYGGTSWFFLLLASFPFQTALSTWLEHRPGGEMEAWSPIFVWVTIIFSIAGGVGMLVGMFWRPAIRGIFWIAVVALALIGEIVFSEFYRMAWVQHTGSFGAWVGELLFAFWLAVGLFRAIFDALVIRGSYYTPPVTLDRSEQSRTKEKEASHVD